MASGVFNRSKGRVNEYIWRINNNDPANSGLVIMLLQAAEADAVLQDYDNFSLLLAAAGNTECTFTNYARRVLTDADLVDPTVDDTNNRQESDFPDQTWVNAGGAVNNSIVKLITGYDSDTLAGDDTGIAPMTYHDFVFTTNGSSLTGQVATSGFFRAA